MPDIVHAAQLSRQLMSPRFMQTFFKCRALVELLGMDIAPCLQLGYFADETGRVTWHLHPDSGVDAFGVGSH